MMVVDRGDRGAPVIEGHEMQKDHFINGRWVAPALGGKIAVVNPATEEVFHHIAAGTKEDIDLAVVAARAAFDTGGWPQLSGKERGRVLRAIAQSMENRKATLARLEVLDNGKPLPEAEWDIADAIGCFAYYAALAEELDERKDEAIPLTDGRFRSKAVREPVGVCGAITPWNYPLLMAAWKVAPALAAGCTMVLKPSELTSITALELGAIAEEAGLPAGVLNIVTGTGLEAGHALSNHPDVDKLAFTGSGPVGSEVMAAAARDIKRVSLELGGKSPFIVFGDSDIEKAVEWIMFGVFWNQGQVCSATSRVFIHDTIYDELLQRLIVEARNIKIGDGFAPGVRLGPLVSDKQLSRVSDFVDQARACGAIVAAGGRRAPGFDKGYFFEPTILLNAPLDSDVWRKEIFGPVVCLRKFDSEAEAIALANDSAYGLAAAVMSRDEVRAHRVAAHLRAGIVWINCSQPTFTEAPWGGYKKSGIGRELGRWGFENYLETKQITQYLSEDPWGWYIS